MVMVTVPDSFFLPPFPPPFLPPCLPRRPTGGADPPNEAQKKTTTNGHVGEKGEKGGAGGGAKKQPPGVGGGRGAGAGAEQGAGRDGITVVSAFEGYAFDAGMRAGDRITAINGKPVEGVTVDKVGDGWDWGGIIFVVGLCGGDVWMVAIVCGLGERAGAG